MKKKTVSVVLATSLMLGGAFTTFTATQPVEAKTEQKVAQPIVLEDTFNQGSNGWSGSFSDYPVGSEEFYELSYSLKHLPANLDSKQKALFLGGNNHSDDLFMYVTKPVHMTHKVKPNTTYKVDFDFDIATNEAADSFGIGGSPASSLHVKVGASIVKPKTYVKEGYNRLNIDHGDQKNDGKNAILVGDLGKLHTADDSYEIKNFKHESKPFYIKSDSKGQLWLIVGTDSGYEGITKYYIPRIKAVLTEVPSK